MFFMIRYALPVACAAAIFSPMIASAGEVYNREMHQEQRIFDGVRDGQITASEFRNLERRELSVNAQRVVNLNHDGGHLTRDQYWKLNHRLNSISNSIYVDRHN